MNLTRAASRIRHGFVLSVLLFSVGTVGGALLYTTMDFDAIENTSAGSPIPDLTFLGLLTNNSFVYALMLLGAVTFGVTAFLFLFNTALFTGFAMASVSGHFSTVEMLALFVPHAILELPAYFIASAIGFHVSWQVVQYLRGARETVVTKEEISDYILMSALGFALIVVSAFIEARITMRVYELVG